MLVRQPEQPLHRRADLAVGGERPRVASGSAGAEPGRVGQPLQPGVADRDRALAGPAQLAGDDVAGAADVEDQPDGPRLALGASAPADRARSSQRGTEPYRAKTMASMTVDLPAPVGPTSAK